jgi:hypothetical protein
MHDVIVDKLRADHQIADQLRIRRNAVSERVLDSTYGSYAMHQGADTANALCKRPRITRVSTAKNDLYAPDHGAGRVRLRDSIAVRLDFDAQVTFDASHRINNDECHYLQPQLFIKCFNGIDLTSS